MILDGKLVAAALDEGSARLCEELKANGVQPRLAILRLGERPDDMSYERGAAKRCAKVGVEVEHCALPADVTQEELLKEIDRLNRDESIHGVLMLRPFPPQIKDETVRAALDPEKDIDGVTDGSLAGVFTGTGRGFAPCTARACMEILDHYNIDVTGMRAAVVGRSLVVGRPAAMLLTHKNATVTLCHTRTKDLPARCREAELLLVAAGKAGAVGADCAAPGQIVLDVGIHVGEDGKLRGDVDFAAFEPVARAITPVPGGVGAVTTSVLVRHVLEAARRQKGL
ncbi:MAG: bifunctional 5,10-methylenetetrahydrofolate dehydrogenase/5,10-methenyltetrahydrofolate cyclohydrolase [Oscillospiraceae bacterium]|nr:bifunctional 5,10-methylenetetrahydrofolate dehydrogenase/5,10-methenyltetrahydrofolate cyclohydrolase [Oscillospiraceae bacterium]